MTGKIKESDFLNTILDFIHIPDSYRGILEELYLKVHSLLYPKLFFLIRMSELQKSSTLKDWIGSIDDLTELIEVSSMPVSLIQEMRLPAEIQYAIPVRGKVLNKRIIALLFFYGTSSSEIILLQILCKIASQKLDLESLEKKIHMLSQNYEIGKIAQELFHEIKNKLIAPSTFLQIFPEKYQDEKFRNEFSSLALTQIHQIQDQIAKALRFGKIHSFEKNNSVTFSQTVSECFFLLEPMINKWNIHIQSFIDDKIRFPLNYIEMKDVLFNLLINSIHALENREEKSIIITSFEEKDSFGFSLEDTGCGIPIDFVKNVFDPYFTTKEEGTGLGLSIVKKIIEAKNGFISVCSIINEGTKFTVGFRNRSSECASH